MARLSFFVVVCLLGLVTLFLSTPTDAVGCKHVAQWTNPDFQRLMSLIRAEYDGDAKYLVYTENIADTSRGFDRTQFVTILNEFLDGVALLDVINASNELILDLNCASSQTFLRYLLDESTRLDALSVLVNYIIDLKANYTVLLQGWLDSTNRARAQQIINSARPRSCLWGDVSADKLVFVVDHSNSMSSTFVADDGLTYSRLKFVVKELNTVIRGDLLPHQLFNLIGYSNSARAWQRGIVSAIPSNLDSAVTFVNGFKPDGATATLAALKLAFSDSQVAAVYLLSDGEPTDASASTIIQAASAWSNAAAPGQRKVNAIAFLAGESETDIRTRMAFMEDIAKATGGLFKGII